MTITALSSAQFLEEAVVFFRNQDIFTTTVRGVTRVTETFNGTGAQTTFTLTNTPVHNVKAVTISSVAKTFGTDYLVNYTTAVVTFTVAPASGTNNVSIQYDYGSFTDERIFGSYPKRLLATSKFPRINLDITSIDTEEIGLFAVATRSIGYYDLVIWALDPRDYVDAVRTAVLNNKKTFYYAKLVTMSFTKGAVPANVTGDEILQSTQELKVWFNVEK